jgi:hypothetical protein
MEFIDEIFPCHVPRYTPTENFCWYIPRELQWKKKKKKWHGMLTYGITEEINSSVKFTGKFIGKINPSVKFAHELWKTNPNESTIVGWINPLIKTDPKPLLISPNYDPNKS